MPDSPPADAHDRHPVSSSQFYKGWWPLAYKLAASPYFDNLEFATLMQVILSATLSRLYRVLGDFHMSSDFLGQTFYLVFWFLPLFHWN